MSQAIISVMEKINGRTPLSELDLLEAFGRDGKFQAVYYASLVRSATIWEIHPLLILQLHLRFPYAHIKHVDSYKEIRNVENRFGLVVLDPSYVSKGDHFEAFDLFPYIYRAMLPKAYLVLTLYTDMDGYLKANSHELSNEWKSKREAFYHSKEPIPLLDMLHVYRQLATYEGFDVTWDLTVKRNESVSYYAQECVKQ